VGGFITVWCGLCVSSGLFFGSALADAFEGSVHVLIFSAETLEVVSGVKVAIVGDTGSLENFRLSEVCHCKAFGDVHIL
jgi:hypothetical protein